MCFCGKLHGLQPAFFRREVSWPAHVIDTSFDTSFLPKQGKKLKTNQMQAEYFFQFVGQRGKKRRREKKPGRKQATSDAQRERATEGTRHEKTGEILVTNSERDQERARTKGRNYTDEQREKEKIHEHEKPGCIMVTKDSKKE